MFDYLTSEEQTNILKLIEKVKSNDEIMLSIELLAKLQVPFILIESLIIYKLNLDIPNANLDIVNRLKKLDLSERYARNEENEKEIYSELFVALGSSIDVIIVKLVSELAFLRLNKSNIENSKVRAAAKLSEDIYGPLCHRLGLGEMKVEFEDLSIYILDNDTFFTIAKKLNLKKQEREQLIEQMISDIKYELEPNVSEFNIFGRSKHIYSIYKKIEIFDKEYEDLFDLLAIRIICKTKVECYTILGLIHQIYPPIDNRFKDYIARPKANMYQSLHTTVHGEQGEVFEIQIRTEEMDNIAELGVAAHFAYKEQIENNESIANKLTT